MKYSDEQIQETINELLKVDGFTCVKADAVKIIEQLQADRDSLKSQIDMTAKVMGLIDIIDALEVEK